MEKPNDHRSRLRVVHAFLPILVAVSLTTSCVTSEDTGGGSDAAVEQTPDSNPSTGASSGTGQGEALASTSTSSTEAGQDFRIDVNSFNRQDDETVVLDISMSNLSSEGDIYIPLPPESGDSPSDYQWVSLLDGKNSKKHLPLLYASGECYCETWSERSIGPGESTRMWMAFPAPPKDVESMIFMTSVSPPILDVPLSGSSRDDIEPPSGDLAEPQIWDLQHIQDESNDESSRVETGDEVAVSLSSDVLFEVNEATLSPQSETVLEQVAKEIDASSDTTVNIDGHTDTSGSDSVNQPLSEERASAVQEALSELVDRSGVEYEVAGHGSSEPIAPNDTEAGRKKNRRVTITFDK